MICKNCKRNIDDDSIYCKFCGEKQIRERKKKAEIKVPAPKQLPSNTWFGRIMVNGQRVSVSAATEKEYYAKARAMKAGLIETAATGPKVTLKQLLEGYVAKTNDVLSPATIRGYETITRNRFPAYMDKDIKTIDFQAMINDEARREIAGSKRLSPKTICNSWGLVRTAMEDAEFPVPRVNLPQKIRYDGDWLDYKQIKKFLSAIHGDSVEVAAILALHSLRQSELLDLNTDSIVDGKIIVKGAVVQDKNQKFIQKPTNKNAASARTVPILIPRLLEILPESGPLVTMHPSSITRHLKKCCIAAGLPVVTLHDLRRSFASLAHHLKWSERTTMVVGGWSNMDTVHKVYERLSDLDRDKDVKRMQKYYKNWQ